MTSFLSRVSLKDDRGLSVSCPGKLGEEVIVVKCSGVAASDLLSHLRFILHAETAEREDRITRSPAWESEREDAERLTRRSEIARFLDTERASIEKQPNAEAIVNATFASLRQLAIDLRNGVHDPSGTFRPDITSASRVLLSRLLIEVGPDTLAQLPYDRTVVLSSRPTAAQNPIGFTVQPFLSDFLNAQKLLVGAFPQQLLDDEDVRPWSARLLSDATKASLGVDKINLFLRRTESVICELAVYSPAGELITVIGITIPLRPLPSEPIRLPLHERATVPLSALSVEFHRVLPFGRSRWWESPLLDATEPSDALRERMLDPVSNDPLSYSVSDALLGIANQLGVHLAACISDTIIDDISAAMRGAQIHLAEFVNLLSRHHEIVLQDGWLLVRPSSPITAERARVPRHALSNFVREAMREGGTHLRNYSAFCYSARASAFISSVPEIYAAFVALTGSGTYSETIRMFPRSAYYLLGSLDAAQWQLITERGIELRLAALSAEQQIFAKDIIGLHARACERSPRWDPTRIPDILLTGSEALPNGLNPDTTFAVQSLPERALVSARPLRFGAADGFMSAPRTTEYIRQEVRAAIANSNEFAGPEDLLVGEYLVGSRVRQTFVIAVRPGIHWTMTYEGAFTMGVGPFRYADLPSEIRREIERSASLSTSN